MGLRLLLLSLCECIVTCCHRSPIYRTEVETYFHCCIQSSRRKADQPGCCWACTTTCKLAFFLIYPRPSHPVFPLYQRPYTTSSTHSTLGRAEILTSRYILICIFLGHTLGYILFGRDTLAHDEEAAGATGRCC